MAISEKMASLFKKIPVVVIRIPFEKMEIADQVMGVIAIFSGAIIFFALPMGILAIYLPK